MTGAGDSDSGRIWPRISVVTPSFNQGRFIEATMQSVLGQGYPNLEYIVIDGGSTDGSVDIIRRYSERLAYWCSEPDHGQYDAINKGFAHATGEIMAWLNSDDVYLPWTFQTVAAVFRDVTEAQWLTTSAYLAKNQSDEVIACCQLSGFCRTWFDRGYDLWGKKNFVMQESTFWRRALWAAAGGRVADELKAAGDYELWQRFWRIATLVTVPAPLACFRHHPAQKTAQKHQYLEEAEMVWRRGRRRPTLAQRVAGQLGRLGLARAQALMGGRDRQARVAYDQAKQMWVYQEEPIVP